MIEVKDVHKRYGTKVVLEGINMKINAQEICCLLGKNGAGKSTLMNIIAQAIEQDSGEVRIREQVFGRNSVLVKQKMGLVSQFDYLIDALTGRQYLTFHGLLYNMPGPEIESRIKDLSGYFFDDPAVILRPIRTYSSGMRMLLNIVAALFHRPDILLLDEPFANLDPLACEKLVLLLKEFASTPGKLVLLSSHDLLYVEKIATRILVLDNRQMVFDGSKAEFTEGPSHHLDKKFLELIHHGEIPLDKLKSLF